MNTLKMSLQVDTHDLQRLVKLVAEGDEIAFKSLFNKYQPTVFKVAMLYLKNTHQAEEIVQDVFLRIWINRENLTTIMSFESWLFILTKNHTLNHIKKQARDRSKNDDWSIVTSHLEPSVENEYINKESEKTFKQAISLLSYQQQISYKLAKEDGLSYKAIGLKLAISPLTVKTHISRALSNLRNFFKEKNNL